jgi:hypothetical protein
MGREMTPQQKWCLGSKCWGSTALGLILFILNTGFYFQPPLAQWLGLSVLDGTGVFFVWVLYLLFCFFVFFLIGLLRGHDMWTASAATRLSVMVGLIGNLPVIVLSVVIGVILLIRIDWVLGFGYVVDGLILAPVVGCSEILISVGGVQLGRIIACRFLRLRQAAE